MASPAGRDVQLLLVEDDEGDVLMTLEALAEPAAALPRSVVHVARDGAEALDFLRQRGAHAHVPLPDLVLLDLNLPLVGGHEVLAEIKSDPALHRIPVVVLTTSSADEDVGRSYDLHANVFVTKPAGFDAFAGAIRAVLRTFTVVATLPPRNRIRRPGS